MCNIFSEFESRGDGVKWGREIQSNEGGEYPYEKSSQVQHGVSGGDGPVGLLLRV